jgi:hypothetical protein
MVVMNPGWVSTDMGGKGAPLSPEKSVSSMRRTIAALSIQHKGCFLQHDGKAMGDW